ncbi:unnamed protein product [Scytosiphon promiscuus]
MLPSPGGNGVMSASSLGPGGMTVSVGKVASALLAKHVRTLEVLHSLQRRNAELKQELQEKSEEEEIRRRIAEAVAAAVAAPNDLTKELQSQEEGLRRTLSGLKEELASSKEASAKALEDANIQMDALRALKLSLEQKCKDLEFEAGCQARRASRQGDLESQLRESCSVLAKAEGRAADLAERLAEGESATNTLKLRLKENEDSIRAMKTAEAVQTTVANQVKSQLTSMRLEVQGLREKVNATELERVQLGMRLEQALLELKASKEENANQATSEQRLLEKISEQSSRASALDSKLSEERKRFQRLREDAKQKLEEEARRSKEMLMEYAYEREQLMQRIEALSRLTDSLRSHMNNNRSQFSKYVEAKTENSQLKEELDGLREMVASVPRPPHRSNSLGSGSSVMNSTLGGVINKHISVERLRHSISVARGHPTNNTPTSSKRSNGSSGIPIGGGGSKSILIRRHSSDHSGSGDGSSGWTGLNQAPSSKFAVTPAGSCNGGGKRARGNEICVRQGGMRPAQQFF